MSCNALLRPSPSFGFNDLWHTALQVLHPVKTRSFTKYARLISAVLDQPTDVGVHPGCYYPGHW